MLVVDSAKRYSVSQIVQHPWMRAGLDDAENDSLLEENVTEDENIVSADTELGQQILRHMASLGLDTESTIRVYGPSCGCLDSCHHHHHHHLTLRH